MNYLSRVENFQESKSMCPCLSRNMKASGRSQNSAFPDKL